MLHLFLDSSAFAKLLIREPGSDEVRALAARTSRVSVSELLYVEFYSMLFRKKVSGQVDDGVFATHAHAFEELWHSRAVAPASRNVIARRIPLGREVIADAKTVYETLAPAGVHVRSLDCLHLACARRAIRSESLSRGDRFWFVTSDARLKKAGDLLFRPDKNQVASLVPGEV
mgnify:CR=1 FL=1